jgi:amino-acid N-acetyltransferase
MIHANSYEQIRPMIQDDITDVLKIMKPFVNQGILIERSQEKLLQEMPDFVVYEIDKKILACGALHVKGENSGEIAGIATDFDSKTSGSGKAIVDYLTEKGISMGVKMFFALTTHTSDWFETQGFSKGLVTDLPKWKQDIYNHSRNSRIYIKRI